MTTEQFMKEAAHIVEERETLYGSPVATLEQIAKRWSLTLKHPFPLKVHHVNGIYP